MSRAEKVALIRQTIAEFPALTHRERAERLGMKKSSYWNLLNDPDGSKQRARREAYKSVCADCGGETSSDGTSRASERCAECAKPEKYWTRERVIEAIQRWAAEHDGKPPTATDWLHASATFGGHPAATNCYRSAARNAPFASWADAVEAAGFPRPRWCHYERTDEWREGMRALMTPERRAQIGERTRRYYAARDSQASRARKVIHELLGDGATVAKTALYEATAAAGVSTATTTNVMRELGVETFVRLPEVAA